MQYTNNYNLSPIISNWLLKDEYDNVDLPNYISATSIIKPIKQIILGKRVVSANITRDISDFFAGRMGTAIHDSIEKSWMNLTEEDCANFIKNTKYKKVSINPDKSKLDPESLNIFIEQRTIKPLDGWNIGGKFDFVIDGQLHDIKTTSTYTYINDSHKESYILQGSIYKWLNPDIITSDTTIIEYIFTDWNKTKSLQDPNYPKLRTTSKAYPLLSIEETESYLKEKVRQLNSYIDSNEEDIPECSDKDLWRTETTYKYYSNGNTKGRATKVFSSEDEAYFYYANKGCKGTIVKNKGTVRRCQYCSGFPMCKQRLQYFSE